jgi:hypothetical protein
MQLTSKTLVLLLVVAFTRPAAGANALFVDQVRAGQSIKVVTMGTSLTTPSVSSWVPRITAWLQGQAPNPASVTVVNVGVGGSSSDNADPAMSGMKTQLPKALTENPDVLFIEFATNDSFTPFSITQQQSKENLNTILDQLQQRNPKLQVVIMTMDNVAGAPGEARPDIAAYFQGYREVAAARGAVLVDNYPNWLALFKSDPARWHSYVPDGIHPTLTGVEAVMIPQVIATLTGSAAFASNGSFEQPSVTGTVTRVNQGETHLTNWQVASGGVNIWNVSALNNTGIHASDGNQLITLQAENKPATIRQTLITVPGRQYRVRFDLAALLGKATGQILSLTVSAAADTKSYTLPTLGKQTTGTASYTLPCRPEEFLFTATDYASTLSFHNDVAYTGDPNGGLSLDHIVVTGFSELSAYPNGSFESPSIDQSLSLKAGDLSLFSWIIKSGGVTLWNAAKLGVPSIQASSRAQFLTLQNNGVPAAISETFDTVPGKQYQVIFDLTALVGKGAGSPANQTLNVKVSASGTSRDFQISTGTDVTRRTLDYIPETFHFKATSYSTTLSFRNTVAYTGDPNGGLSIDNVAISAVPEPGPFANGSFETPVERDASTSIATGTPTLTRWTIDSGAVYLWNAASFTGAEVHASNGNQFLTLQNGGALASISQTFTTIPGRQYQVSFDLSALTTKPQSDLQLKVRVGSVTNRVFTLPPTDSNPACHTMPWTPEKLRFTATSAFTTLSFSNQTQSASDGNWGLALDNVTVEAVQDAGASK